MGKTNKIWGWVLLVHGILCLIGSLLPIHPLVAAFYLFLPIPFLIKLFIVLALGAVQVVLGSYRLLKKPESKLKWYWLVTAAILIMGLTVLFPALAQPETVKKLLNSN
jgi:NADH:ubiquinone oxidoreductase subunit 6 (subunit J)